jgi:hypothetical protein
MLKLVSLVAKHEHFLLSPNASYPFVYLNETATTAKAVATDKFSVQQTQMIVSSFRSML